jgi:hypothetical protein
MRCAPMVWVPWDSFGFPFRKRDHLGPPNNVRTGREGAGNAGFRRRGPDHVDGVIDNSCARTGRQTGERIAPQGQADRRADRAASRRQFALTIDADAGWLSLAWPRSVSSRGHACAVERAADSLNRSRINAKPRRDLANAFRAPRLVQGRPDVAIDGRFLSAAIGTRLSRKAVGANGLDALGLIAQLLAE